MNNKATVTLAPNTSKATPLRRVIIRVIFQRRKREFTTYTSDTFTMEEFKRKRKAFREAEEHAQPALDAAKSIINKLGNGFDFTTFHKMYKEAMEGKRDFSIFHDVANQYYQEKRLKPKTRGLYQTAVNWVDAYKKNANLKEINSDFVSGLINFIKQTHSLKFQNDISENTIRIYLRSLRAIYEYALDKKLTDGDNPFKNIDGQALASIRRKQYALTMEELNLFINYRPKTERENVGKDFFLLSLQLCGANMCDILTLKNHNINLNNRTISFIRKKTEKSGTITTIPFTDEAERLMNKYGKVNVGKPDALIIKYLGNVSSDSVKTTNAISNFIKRVNKGLHSISKALGIRNFTTYSARHTYAMLAVSSGMTAEQIKDELGHTSTRTTQSYLGSISDTAINRSRAVLEGIKCEDS